MTVRSVKEKNRSIMPCRQEVPMKVKLCFINVLCVGKLKINFRNKTKVNS